MDNISLIQGGGEKNLGEEHVRELEKTYPTLLKQITWLAKLTRARFDAFKAEGFTDEQALQLCKFI